MQHRPFFLLASFGLLLAVHAVAAEMPRTNVLFIVADDLCNRLGVYGDPLVQSPHIDRLARGGVRFDRAYCQFPLCNPSRASFLTGLRPDTTRVWNLSTHFRAHLPDVVTLPQLFHQHGYFSARVGKLYHYGMSQIGTDGLDDPPSWNHVVNPRGRDRDAIDQPGRIFLMVPGDISALSWLPDDGTDLEQTDGIGATTAIKLLEQHAQQPFFLAVGFYRPHTPLVAPKSYFERYPLERIPLTAVPKDHQAGVPRLAFRGAPIKVVNAYQAGLTEPLQRAAVQAYSAATTFMDAQVGRLLDALDRLKLADRTVVVLTSDHGFHLGEHGLWQKNGLFEESARVPLIIRAPGARGNGRACRRTVELVDLYPTLAEWCGLPAPANLAGQSLRPLLHDPEAAWSKPAFTQVSRSPTVMGWSIRTERWRYTEWDGGKQGTELYDHTRDAQEYNNLADDPRQAATVDELRRLLREHR